MIIIKVRYNRWPTEAFTLFSEYRKHRYRPNWCTPTLGSKATESIAERNNGYYPKNSVAKLRQAQRIKILQYVSFLNASTSPVAPQPSLRPRTTCQEITATS